MKISKIGFAVALKVEECGMRMLPVKREKPVAGDGSSTLKKKRNVPFFHNKFLMFDRKREEL